MASKQENPNELMDKQQKKLFFEKMQSKHKILAKRQREYKEILAKRHKTRGETIIQESLWKAIDTLQDERNELRSQIWVANGALHLQENDRCLKEIQCHVDCQEHLSKEINALKVAIANMEREVSRTGREIYELNRQIVPESQHQQHVARMRKKKGILENQLEVAVRRECIFSAENAGLREELENILHERAQFNNIYMKLVQSLNSDKKYMTDLLEYAANAFDNCITLSERTDLRLKKITKESEARKTEVQSLIRTFTANQVVDKFLGTKGQTREIAPHQPKELRRRANYKYNHRKKITLYNEVIGKLLDFSNSVTVYDVIERFQQHESFYYSYFTLDNEREFHITLLNNSVNRLYGQVEYLKLNNFKRFTGQMQSLNELEKKLDDRLVRSQELDDWYTNDTRHLKKCLHELQSIMIMCRLSHQPLMAMLGDHTRVSLKNMRRFTKLLEERIIKIVKAVYLAEREDPSIPLDEYVVKDIEKTSEAQTKLADIVLTQQCPECAEGEAFTADGDYWVPPTTTDEAKKALFEKVNQPEMQYRLHSVSQCRLPRSRLLAAKRHT